MTARFYKNAPAHTIPGGVVNAVTTAIVVDSIAGWPTQFPFTAIIEPDLTLEEIVDVTAIVGTTLTVVRGADGSTASAHAAGVKIVHGFTARDATEANDHINDTTDVHGSTGSVVGTGGTQTISGQKNFTGGLQRGGSEVVDLGSVQTITGQKNFTGGLQRNGFEVMDTGTAQTVGGQKTFSLRPIVSGNGDVVTTGGLQTIDGSKTFTGTETHSGVETHSGDETHSGKVELTHADLQVAATSNSADELSNNSTTFTPGGTSVGTSFTAPPSGNVWVNLFSYFGQDINGKEAAVSFRMGTGSVVGAGTLVLAPSQARGLTCGEAVNASAPAHMGASCRVWVPGLTPGSSYNVEIQFVTTTGGAISVFDRSIQVEPSLV